MAYVRHHHFRTKIHLTKVGMASPKVGGVNLKFGRAAPTNQGWHFCRQIVFFASCRQKVAENGKN